ncbi:uncharacterized protein UBRO_21010 [Ustilago bromivora]|uniref:Uncharacterized protein n=1 Tax=Ustilago bromivora TaxID=307758 RepID=A0A1K0G8K8_9BASI|nr:uncharacterized protein UBRO_21010 [Ustilago bromivora]
MDPVPTPFIAQPPLVLPATTPVLDPMLSAPPALEYQPSITCPWLPVDLIDKAHQDILSIYDLPKLANPLWPGSTALEEPAPVLIEGFSVIKGPTTSTSNHQFIKAVPNFLTFGQLWVIYLLLRSSTSNDRDLPVSLGHFYQHVTDLAEGFPWDKVAGYVIAVCMSCLGKATTADLACFDTELHAMHFQGV